MVVVVVVVVVGLCCDCCTCSFPLDKRYHVTLTYDASASVRFPGVCGRRSLLFAIDTALVLLLSPQHAISMVSKGPFMPAYLRSILQYARRGHWSVGR